MRSSVIVERRTSPFAAASAVPASFSHLPKQLWLSQALISSWTVLLHNKNIWTVFKGLPCLILSHFHSCFLTPFTAALFLSMLDSWSQVFQTSEVCLQLICTANVEWTTGAIWKETMALLYIFLPLLWHALFYKSSYCNSTTLRKPYRRKQNSLPEVFKKAKTVIQHLNISSLSVYCSPCLSFPVLEEIRSLSSWITKETVNATSPAWQWI